MRSLLVVAIISIVLGAPFADAAANDGVPSADPTVVEVRVSAGSDDAEEAASGSVSRSSSDLELVQEKSTQTVGIRVVSQDVV